MVHAAVRIRRGLQILEIVDVLQGHRSTWSFLLIYLLFG